MLHPNHCIPRGLNRHSNVYVSTMWDQYEGMESPGLYVTLDVMPRRLMRSDIVQLGGQLGGIQNGRVLVNGVLLIRKKKKNFHPWMIVGSSRLMVVQ